MGRRCQPTTHLMRSRGTVGNWHRLFPNLGIFIAVSHEGCALRLETYENRGNHCVSNEQNEQDEQKKF